MISEEEKKLSDLDRRLTLHEQGETGDVRLSPKALTMFILFALGGNGALTYMTTRPDTVRPDPFTGTEGRHLQLRIEENKRQSDLNARDIKDLERRLDALERKGHG